MCGILGICLPPDFKEIGKVKDVLTNLFILSESRGKEASGMAVCNGKEIRYLKTPFPASDLVESVVFSKEISTLVKCHGSPVVVIGHSRLVTNGYEHDNINNQPVVKNGIVGVHNGIITNADELWKKYPKEEKISELDSELIPTLISMHTSAGLSIPDALRKMYDDICGMTTISALFANYPLLLLSTNNGSLYYLFDDKYKTLVFASERHFLNEIVLKLKLSWLSIDNIRQLNTNNYLLFDFMSSKLTAGKLHNMIPADEIIPSGVSFRITEITGKISNKSVAINRSMEHVKASFPDSITREVFKREAVINSIQRCTKCILPETFPFISFDQNGVCNYCHNYKPLQFKGLEFFRDHVGKYKSAERGKPDCLVPFSGGRDSSFVLHFVKKELGLNPIAFSYDWGMLTDLARRNQARMCGALGVEHILVSADIRKKRENIRKNVCAWFKRPRLGTVPLFMAGDKQYFYFANLLMKQNGLHVSILGENMLETTRFKSGFCGILPRFDTDKTYTLSTADKIQLALYYSREYICNPAFFNFSLFDTIDAFKSYYIIRHNNENIFDYIQWDEKKIINILIDGYNWETDPETTTTWRIGDGTTAFYNYIYYMVAGFSENDTFRSNQIREGMLDRDTALKITLEDNAPRFDSIKWYCDTIGIDPVDAIKRINAIPTSY